MRVYKIRDTKTGLYSMGGCAPKWSRVGKVWTTEGALKSHLTLWMCTTEYRMPVRQVPKSWEVVVLEERVGLGCYARALANRPAKK